VDYPKSLPSVGLVGGKFVDEDAVAGTPGSLIPALWGNAVTDELLALIAASGLVPDENDNTQLAAAINKIAQKGQVVYALDTGVANVYAASFTPAITALVDGMVLKVKAKTANTGSCTFNPNGLGAKSIVGGGHAVLQGGEIIANSDVWLQYNTSIGGGSWILVDSTGGALPLAPATRSSHAIQVAQVQAGTGLYAADTASGNVYSVNYAPAILALTDGMTLNFKASTSNTGPSTFSPSGLAAKAIVGLANAPLQGGEIFATGTCTVVYSLIQDKWVLVSCSGGATQVAPATQSQHAVPLGQVSGLISGNVTSISADTTLTSAQNGLVIIDATAAPRTITLPTANAALGVKDYIVRRADNGGNRLVVQASGTDKIKFHTHLNAAGYPFLVLMGAGDWWHLRSDSAGSWWPIGRYDNTPLGRPAFETTTAFQPGGWAGNNNLYNRAEWPWVWDHAQASGMLTTEALRAGKEGMWTSGDGVSTFRSPDLRGWFLRPLDESAGLDAGRVGGSSQTDDNKAHNHSLSGAGGYGTTMQGGGTNNYALWTAGSTGSSGGAEARPKNIALPNRFKMI
jgi:hypothetical protein